jgi:hypothetical protein
MVPSLGADAARAANEHRLAHYRLVTEASCWEWTGTRTRRGYGLAQDSLLGKQRLVHRLSWEMWRDPIPDGWEIDHLCKNRACFNPDHLRTITAADHRRLPRTPNT